MFCEEDTRASSVSNVTASASIIPTAPAGSHLLSHQLVPGYFAGALHTSKARFANSATEPTPARFSRTRLYPKAEIGSKELTNRKDISMRQQFNSV